MNKNDLLFQTLTKPAAVGVVGAVVTYYLFGETGSMVLLNQVIPGWLGVGVCLTATTLASETLGNYVLPLIPKNYQTAKTEKLVLEPVINGLALYALLSVTTPNVYANGFKFPLECGILSTIAGNYMVDTFKPLLL
jgi:hypothetical protein